MPPILFDTTVWIAYLNGVVNPHTDLLYQYVDAGQQVLTCPIIIQEVRQGIRDDGSYRKVRQSMLGFTCLDLPSLDAALGAADLYRNLRKKGITIRKANDCLIAFYALHFDVALCHDDRYFDLIASQTSLKIFQVQ
jgi:predicted nucleic acid-binding protein